MIKNLPKLILILALVSTIIALLLFLRVIDKRQYDENAETLKEQFWGGYHIIPFDIYFNMHYEAPINLDELHDIVQDYPIIPNDIFTDPFSSNRDSLLYIPVYNPNNLKRESVLLISAGVDGKINNRHIKTDTIFNYMVNDEFQFYNKPTDISIPQYCLLKRLFGKKDFVLIFNNLFEGYKNIFVSDSIFDFRFFIDQINNEKYLNKKLNKKYWIELNNNNIIESGNCRLTLKSGTYKICFNFYDCDDTEYLLEKKTTNLICKLGSLALRLS